MGVAPHGWGSQNLVFLYNTDVRSILMGFMTFSKVRRNHFHDAAGSGGRLLLQTPRLALADNVFERFGGLYICKYRQSHYGMRGSSELVNIRN